MQEADVAGCSSYVDDECDLSEAGAPAYRVNDGSSTSFVAFASVFLRPVARGQPAIVTIKFRTRWTRFSLRLQSNTFTSAPEVDT